MFSAIYFRIFVNAVFIAEPTVFKTSVTLPGTVPILCPMLSAPVFTLAVIDCIAGFVFSETFVNTDDIVFPAELTALAEFAEVFSKELPISR